MSDGFSNVNKPAADTTAPAPAGGGGGGGGFAAYAKINPFAAMGPPMGFGTSSSKTTASSNIAISNITTKIAPQTVPLASTSPKTNPFGASNPAHNPFMNFVADSKPNVDYWQKFKEPVKVPASDAVSSSDVKVTFVNPSSGTHKQQQESSASAFSTSTPKSATGNSTTTTTSSNIIMSASSSSGGISSDSIVPQTSAPEVSTQSSEDNDELNDEEETEVTDDASTTSVISEKKPAIDTAAMFHKPTELDNGEAGEECVLKLRAKLYRLSEVEKGSDSVAKEWVEVGTGPVRLLSPAAAQSSPSSFSSGSGSTDTDAAVPLVFPRIVMRREHQAGGPGTHHVTYCQSISCRIDISISCHSARLCLYHSSLCTTMLFLPTHWPLVFDLY